MGDANVALAGAGRADVDRISGFSDAVLGHILSFLPAKEAARAAALSTRWRDVFASVHTVSLEEEKEESKPVSPDGYYDRGWDSWQNLGGSNSKPPFVYGVGAALLARHRGIGGAAATPLRALRLDFAPSLPCHTALLDQWITYAVRQAGDELHLDLRIRDSWLPISDRRWRCPHEDYIRDVSDVEDASLYSSSHASSDSDSEHESSPDDGAGDEEEGCMVHPNVDDGNYGDEEEGVLPNVDDGNYGGEEEGVDYGNYFSDDCYTLPRRLFSCAALRTLRLETCGLNPPATVDLPAVETLHLSHLLDEGRAIQRVISGCPRLADLMLENCEGLTELAVVDQRLRRLALWCCHNLESFTVEVTELHTFEYTDSVPARRPSFLMAHGSRSAIATCKVALCGVDSELSSEKVIVRFREFLSQLAGMAHLHLESARLGFARLPGALSSLRHLELTGCTREEDAATIAGAMSRMLHDVPNLEVLSLFFRPEPRREDREAHSENKEVELLDAHHLSFDRRGKLDVPASCAMDLRVREINFVHYMGGRAQRTLAKFLLCSAPAIEELWCEFAEGPLWIQTELMREITGWVMNKSANMSFF